MKKYFIMARFISAFLFSFLGRQLPVWAEGPLVIVVHGVGDGNRPSGWANKFRDAYQIPRPNWVEVNFNLAGRDEQMLSTVDFAHQAGEWASQVQQGIMAAVQALPGRKVMIISHSWGTIATSIALNGGAMPGAEINPIQLEGRRIARWVTLASPLGRANNPKVAPNLRQLNVQVSTEIPSVVDAWVNIYDRDDPVSMQSHNLPSAENIEVSKSGAIEWIERTLSLGLTTHTAIWLHPTTIKLIQQYYRELEQRGTGRIFVKVIRKRDNTGVADARLVAILRGGINSITSTDKQGNAILEAIPIGSYVIEATPLTGAGLRSGRASLELQEGESVRVTITLEEQQKEQQKEQEKEEQKEEQKEKRELFLISATVQPEEGAPGRTFYFALSFGIKGVQTKGQIQVNNQLEVRGPLTLPFTEKAWTLDGADAVAGIVKGTIEANAAFAKPGKYVWSYFVTAEGCATPLRGSVPFWVEKKEEANQAQVTVPGGKAWTSTGLIVNDGDTVAIKASGTVYANAETPCPVDGIYKPEWERFNVISRTRHEALIAKIGDSGRPFIVGSGLTFKANISGMLFLGVNDNKLDDNSGAFNASVNIARTNRQN